MFRPLGPGEVERYLLGEVPPPVAGFCAEGELLHFDWRETRATAGPGPSLRRLGSAVTLGVVVLALVGLVLPASAALGRPASGPTIRLQAPFVGATSGPVSSATMTGCGHAANVTPAYFHGRTGIGGFSGISRAGLCGGTFGTATASYVIVTQVPIPSISGNHTISARWVVDASGAQSLHLGKCRLAAASNGTFSGCFASAFVTLSAYAYLYDATTGGLIRASHGWAGLSNGTNFAHYCDGVRCFQRLVAGLGTFAVSAPAVWNFHAMGLVPTDAYWLVTAWSGMAYVDVGVDGAATFGPTHGVSWLDAGTFGEGLRLASVTIQ